MVTCFRESIPTLMLDIAEHTQTGVSLQCTLKHAMVKQLFYNAVCCVTETFCTSTPALHSPIYNCNVLGFSFVLINFYVLYSSILKTNLTTIHDKSEKVMLTPK